MRRRRSLGAVAVIALATFAALPAGAAFAEDPGPSLAISSVAPVAPAVGSTYNITATSDSPATITFTPNANCAVSAATPTSATVTFTHVGTCTINADQPAVPGLWSGDGALQMINGIVKGDQTINIPAPMAANNFVGSIVGLGAVAATSGLTVTLTSLTPSICTVSGTAVTFIAVGNPCTVQASQAGNTDYNAAPNVTTSTNVGKGTPTITFAQPTTPALAGTSVVVAPTVMNDIPASTGAVALTSATPTVCTVAGFTISYIATGTCTLNADKAGDANYNAATQVQRTVTVNTGTQTITFPAPADGVVGTTVTLSPTSSAGLTVALTTTTPSVCTVAPSTFSVSYLNAGTCTLNANQPGNGSITAAPQVTNSVTVKNNQTITFSTAAPTNTPIGGSYAPAASSTSTLPVSLTSVTPVTCSFSGSVVNFLAAGTCTIAANQPGNTSFYAAPQVLQSFTVGVSAVTFSSSAPAATVGGPTYTVTTVGTGSTAPVVLTIDPVSVGACTITNNVVSFANVGTCTVNANQNGDGTHLASPQVQQAIVVGKGGQTISFTSTPASPALPGSTYNVAATSTSALPVTFTIDPTSASICSVSGSTVTFGSTPGTCTINANQAGNVNYNAAPQKQQAVSVGKLAQTITFTSTVPSDAKTGGAYNVAATASSGLPVTFSIAPSSGNTCTITGSTVSLKTSGTCVITASQAGNATYNAAPQVNQQFLISLAQAARPVMSQVSGKGSITLTTTVSNRFAGQTVIFFVRSGITGKVRPLGTAVVNDQGKAVRFLNLKTGQILVVYSKLLVTNGIVNPYSNDVAFKVQ